MLYDAHNHLQDDRFAGAQPTLLATCATVGIIRMVVNGACEADWPAVLALAKANSIVLPSFGYHPWYLAEATPDWRLNLEKFLDATPSAVGEIGLDRWKPGLDYGRQEEFFTTQLRVAADRNLPASIHCLQAWGRMFELLKAGPRPARGFLLHSYGGPVEMVPTFAKLGAYFSFPGYYLQERKLRQRDTFRAIPPDRLLIETDAPDQPLPPEKIRHPLTDPTGHPLNHPANLPAIYEGLATFLNEPLPALTTRVAENFNRLFNRL